jgi:pimeloyl-ACP methyl ester carboxylesterase
VAIYESQSKPARPDPIVWLVGGPGGKAHFLPSRLFDRVVAPYLWNRDFIVMDIRGTGSSQPALGCPGPRDPDGRWVSDCRERLAGSADLAMYNSAAAAADLADLRRTLGIREWNVFGESYGTRIALTAARDAPEGIRSIVLDSVVPPEADQYADGPAKFEAAILALGRASGARDLRAEILRAADALDTDPRRIRGEYAGRPYDIRLDGRSMLQALHMALYESDLIPRLPGAIRGGDDAAWGQALAIGSVIDRDIVDMGARLSFHCAEEIPFTDWARMRAENDRRPWMRGVVYAPHMAEGCRIWNLVPADPRESLPVESPIPTLLLSGDCDPVTPASYAASAARHLPHSYAIIFPGLGHWVTANTVSTCPQSIVRAFIDNPGGRPRDDCARQGR